MILYPKSLLNSLINSRSICVGFGSFLFKQSCHLQIKVILFLPFLSFRHFISLPCLTLVARTSNYRFNKSGEDGHFCLIPDIRGKAFSISPLNPMLAMDFLKDALYQVNVFLLLNGEEYLQWTGAGFCQILFLCQWIYDSFNLLMCWYYMCWVFVFFPPATLSPVPTALFMFFSLFSLLFDWVNSIVCPQVHQFYCLSSSLYSWAHPVNDLWVLHFWSL